ncbi:queuosine salvage family protein [Naumannella huperziae]
MSIDAAPPGADPLARVRADCAAVAAGARHVRIVDDALGEYAAALPIAEGARPAFDADHHYRGGEPDTVLAVLCLDAINFGSGWFPRLTKRPGMSGYFTVASSLKDWFGAGTPDAAELAALTADRVAEILGQSDNADVAELMSFFARALNELGTELTANWAGDGRALVAAAGRSAARLVGLLAAMPMFRDVATWRGPDGRERPVHLWKRAQLTAVDLSLALDGVPGRDGAPSDLGRFDDLDRLTIFADNLVPHVLRTDGLLAYDDELAAAIDAGADIPAGSAPEVELRACAVHAVELLAAELNRGPGRRVSAADLDYLLWNRGQEPAYRSRPRHRTRTTRY